MKTKPKFLYFLIVGFTLFSQTSFAHDVIVHEAITVNAAASAAAYSSAYGSFLNLIAPNYSPATAVGPLKRGSEWEDNIDVSGDVGGKRSVNHFYDPIHKIGLTDGFSGRDSFSWASISNSPGVDVKLNRNTLNIWSWQNARGYEWLGLTSTNSADRSTYLNEMFRAVGQVMHLLEDTTQPQHVRNEQHLDFYPYIDPYKQFPTSTHSHIEDYGDEHWHSLNYSSSLLNWRNVGFTKLEDFWDGGLYRSNGVSALNNDATGSQPLGLAEWCNGNFLGERALYSEEVDAGDIHHFSFPSLTNSTSFTAIRSHLATGARTSFFKNGKPIKRIYIDKIGDGITFSNHSVLNYLGAYFPGRDWSHGIAQVASTINDQNVLQVYHSILIPKAVEYSAGLLDYYFRGTLTGSNVWDVCAQQYTYTFTNTSGQDFSGGTFYLYQEGTDGQRTLKQSFSMAGIAWWDNSVLDWHEFFADWPSFVTAVGNVIGWNSSGIIFEPSNIFHTNDSIAIVFSGPVTNTTKFTLVYQGTIGIDGSGNALDPVDAGIAIAATSFTVTPPPSPTIGNLTWTASHAGAGASYGGSDGQVTVAQTAPGGELDVTSSTLRLDSPLTVQISYSFTISGADNTVSSDQLHESLNGWLGVSVDGSYSGDLPNGTYGGSVTKTLSGGCHSFRIAATAFAPIDEYEASSEWPYWALVQSGVPCQINGTITITPVQ